MKPAQNLIARCKEILAWQRTGILTGDALREMADAQGEQTRGDLRIAEAETAREAMRFVLEAGDLATSEQPASTNQAAHAHPKLFSVGIHLDYNIPDRWAARIDYDTWEHHADPRCITGSIGTKYVDENLTDVIDRALAAAKAIGVVFPSGAGGAPHIYIDEDRAAVLPSDWRQMIADQCARLGWETCYPVTEKT